ncbi:MAG: hypothetical protein K2V38_10985, partial [Gemmataceae bacterium]|nr:hypothetical protein [Gemmataceae bacterium]
SIAPNALVIRFPPSYAVQYEACAAEAGTQRLTEALKRVTGQPITLKFEKDSTAPPGSRPSPGGNSANGNGRPVALESLPLFKKAKEVLGAQRWHVEDGFDPNPPPKEPRKTETDTDEDE